VSLTVVARYVMQTRPRFPTNAKERRWQKHESWPVYAETCNTVGTENYTTKARAELYSKEYALRNANVDVRVIHRIGE
jgi:hypothetical protein